MGSELLRIIASRIDAPEERMAGELDTADTGGSKEKGNTLPGSLVKLVLLRQGITKLERDEFV